MERSSGTMGLCCNNRGTRYAGGRGKRRHHGREKIECTAHFDAMESRSESVESCLRGSFAPRPRNQFAAASRADVLQLVRAARAERTFVGADEGFAISRQEHFALLAFRAHLESHRLARLLRCE